MISADFQVYSKAGSKTCHVVAIKEVREMNGDVSLVFLVASPSGEYEWKPASDYRTKLSSY
jgi:hypothetical protein